MTEREREESEREQANTLRKTPTGPFFRVAGDADDSPSERENRGNVNLRVE